MIVDAPPSEATAHRFVGRKRRPVEDRRFVLGRGRYAADITLPHLHHVAIVPSRYAHARITSIDASAALALPGVLGIVTGPQLQAQTKPLRQYLDIPGVEWFPLAGEIARYAGEWVVAVVATERAIAEDAVDLIEVGYEPLPAVLDPEAAMDPASPSVHPSHPSNVLYRRTFVWGSVAADFAAAPRTLTTRYRWHRSATVPIETFAVTAAWEPGSALLDVWASVQMPQFPEQIADALGIPLNGVRVHFDVDVGGSYGTKRGIKHAVLVGFLTRHFGVPVSFVEDRLENMRGGDMHGPDRIFDVAAAYDERGVVRSLRIRTIDDEGAYPGRSPLQMGKPVGAIVGAYAIGSVEYEAIAVTTNKTGQVAVRGFGQAPTNFALELTMDRIARDVGIDALEIRRRNFIQPEQFPYVIPSGTAYDSGDYPAVMTKAVDLAGMAELQRWRAAARAEGRIAGIGIASCIEPGGGNAIFQALFNDNDKTTTFPEGCQVKIDRTGTISAQIGVASSGQGHETLVSTLLGEIFGIEPDTIRVIHADSLAGLPSQSPVASRMAIVLGDATVGAARRLREQMLRIAAHDLGRAPDHCEWHGPAVRAKDGSGERTWLEIARIAHLFYHRLPPGMEPGLQTQFVIEVPTGGTLPTPDGRVQMYPCHSFSAHVVAVEIDRGTGKVTFQKYALAHDCGTVINPDIVRGMVMGGVAHGIGAALYERFIYDDDGRLITQTLADYLMPTTHDVPHVEMVEHETPSPFTTMGQKGVGEGGYMSTPAAVVCAINDALAPFGTRVDHVPVTPVDLLELLQ
ncbi:MAG TPA: xanthine dehydrogenase family protein molybdopterin-binding subunit [Candidatus Lustribacter sp.]|jgi:2-furoyl-CoA dehydrogenase large subunit|nr:xanthine dehydrogenase family protein molybdopterin-binding subunit [Candidatus Lustribacter sp.]